MKGGDVQLDSTKEEKPSPVQETEVREAEVAWQDVAAMFDRFFFGIYLVVIVALNVSVLAIFFDGV